MFCGTLQPHPHASLPPVSFASCRNGSASDPFPAGSNAGHTQYLLSPLLLAIEKQHLAIAEALIDHKADPNQVMLLLYLSEPPLGHPPHVVLDSTFVCQCSGWIKPCDVHSDWKTGPKLVHRATSLYRPSSPFGDILLGFLSMPMYKRSTGIMVSLEP